MLGLLVGQPVDKDPRGAGPWSLTLRGVQWTIRLPVSRQHTWYVHCVLSSLHSYLHTPPNIAFPPPTRTPCPPGSLYSNPSSRAVTVPNSYPPFSISSTWSGLCPPTLPELSSSRSPMTSVLLSPLAGPQFSLVACDRAGPFYPWHGHRRPHFLGL